MKKIEEKLSSSPSVHTVSLEERDMYFIGVFPYQRARIGGIYDIGKESRGKIKLIPAVRAVFNSRGGRRRGER